MAITIDGKTFDNKELAHNSIEAPLKLKWDDISYQYKVNKPLDQLGEYVDKSIAEKYREDNALLIEALEMLIFVATDSTKDLIAWDEADYLDNQIDKAKEVLNNLKK